MNMNKFFKNNMKEIDSLRGIWAVLILVFHSTAHPFFFGWSRVDLFFVISGYLATRKLLDPARPERGLESSLGRRLLRLLPSYYLLILVAFALDGPRIVQDDHPAALIAAATLTQNIPLYWSGSPWSFCSRYLFHTWAVAIELQFSAILLVLHRLIGRSILAPLALALLLNSLVLRADGLHPWTLLGRGDGFASGMLLAFFLGKPGRSGRRSTWILLQLAIMLGLGYTAWVLIGPIPVIKALDHPIGVRDSLSVFSMNLIYTGLVGLMACHTGHPVLRPFRARCLVQFGGLSYGIYLFTFVAISLADAVLLSVPQVWHGWATPLALALAILAAFASRAGVERPLWGRGEREKNCDGIEVYSGPRKLDHPSSYT